jgi:hypothetical protein
MERGHPQTSNHQTKEINMWIFTETGFVSAVRKNDRPDVYTVRARDRKSLEPLAAFAKAEIVETPYGDYPLRAFVEPAVFTEWVAGQASSIEYDNFKSRVTNTRGYVFVDALHDVWAAMLKVAERKR